LDEPVNDTVIEMMDYVDTGNRIMCDMIAKWPINYQTPASKQKCSLKSLLMEVFNLYTKAPPLPFEEL
jgi:hypothetical protein